jgi:hypothetical protein
MSVGSAGSAGVGIRTRIGVDGFLARARAHARGSVLEFVWSHTFSLHRLFVSQRLCILVGLVAVH